jgi:uridine kinase
MFDEIVHEIDRLLKEKQKIIIAIDGQSTSGETTLANELSQKYIAPIIHMDDYFLRKEQRTESRLSEIGGNIDYERFEDEVISYLRDLDFDITPFNCKTFHFEPKVHIHFDRLLIIEGAYALRKPWIAHYDLKIVLTIDDRLQIKRITLRNPHMLDRFINEWVPKENRYLLEHQVIEHADMHFHIKDI